MTLIRQLVQHVYFVVNTELVSYRDDVTTLNFRVVRASHLASSLTSGNGTRVNYVYAPVESLSVTLSDITAY